MMGLTAKVLYIQIVCIVNSLVIEKDINVGFPIQIKNIFVTEISYYLHDFHNMVRYNNSDSTFVYKIQTSSEIFIRKHSVL